MHDQNKSSLMSSSLANIAAALAKAQAAMGKLRLNSGLPGVVTAIGDSLTQNDLSYIQRSHCAPEQVVVETVILHATGEFISAGELSMSIGSQPDLETFVKAHEAVRALSLSSALGLSHADPVGLTGPISVASAADGASGVGDVQLPAQLPVQLPADNQQNSDQQSSESRGAQATALATIIAGPVAVAGEGTGDSVESEKLQEFPEKQEMNQEKNQEVSPAEMTLVRDEKEEAALIEKTQAIGMLTDINRLEQTKKRVTDYFSLQSYRDRFLAAVDARIAELTPSAQAAAAVA